MKRSIRTWTQTTLHKWTLKPTHKCTECVPLLELLQLEFLNCVSAHSLQGAVRLSHPLLPLLQDAGGWHRHEAGPVSWTGSPQALCSLGRNVPLQTESIPSLDQRFCLEYEYIIMRNFVQSTFKPQA